jgi:DUF4097 and DUF4098 domain-containing protein YvlB
MTSALGTACRRSSLWAALLLMLFSPSWASAAEDIQDTKTNVFPGRVESLRPRSRLAVTNTHGNVQIRGWNRDQVDINANIEGEAADKIAVEVNKTAGGIEIIVKNNASRRLFGILPPKAAKCDLSLSVPRHILANVMATDGAIDIAGIEGQVKCEATNGEIKLLNILGEVDAKTVNGGISITKLAPCIWPGQPGGTNEPPKIFAGFNGESENGSIHMEDVLGNIKATTIYGQIMAKRMDARDGAISFETVRGDINIEMLRRSTELIVETVVGSIDIKVPNSKAVEESKTRTVVSVPGRLPQVQKISIKTINGTITVR